VEVDHINVRAIHVFDRALTLIGAYWLCAIDACHANTISRPRDIDEIIVDSKIDSLWRASLGYRLGSLLQLDDLFVGVEAAIVNESHATIGLTVRTLVRLHYASAINFAHFSLFAYDAFEESSLYVWNDIAVSNDHALHADQLVDVCKKD